MCQRENTYVDWYEYWYERKKNTIVLFIAESPPAYTCSENYFYNENGKSKNLLGALLTPLDINDGTKEERLRTFIEKYWLIDIFPKPIDCVCDADIQEIREDVKKSIEKINPKKIVIFLPKKAFKHRAMKKFCKKLGLRIDGSHDAENYINLQKDICGKLLEGVDLDVDVKVAPFPSQGILNGQTFRVWANENRGWLEIE